MDVLICVPCCGAPRQWIYGIPHTHTHRTESTDPGLSGPRTDTGPTHRYISYLIKGHLSLFQLCALSEIIMKFGRSTFEIIFKIKSSTLKGTRLFQRYVRTIIQEFIDV